MSEPTSILIDTIEKMHQFRKYQENGYIRDIIYDPQNTSNNLPKAIFIEFDQ